MTPHTPERTIKLLSQRWQESDEDITLERSIVGLIARGELSDREGARWLSRFTTNPQLAAILRNYASDDWDDERFEAVFRSYRSGDGGGATPSPNDKIAKALVQRWDEAEQTNGAEELAPEKSIVGLIARGELSEREGARWLSRLTTSPQFAAILRNYASDNWDDDRFITLFRAYMAVDSSSAPSPSEKIAKLLVDRWEGVGQSKTSGEELAQEKSIVGLIARGGLSEREGARWLSRMTTSPQLAAILRNYASDDWDDDRFRVLFRAYKAGEGDAAPSPNDKIAKALVQRWDEAERSKEAQGELAQEKSIVGLIARGELSERQGAHWLSRLTTNLQLATILRDYASDEWDDDRFRVLFRSYKAGEGDAAPSPNDKIAKALVQRWDEAERSKEAQGELAQEKSIVGLIARGELSEREGARWLSRLTTSPQLAAILRNYASENWDDHRFVTLFRSYMAVDSNAAPSPSEKIAKLLVDRWDDVGRSKTSGEALAQEKSIVGLIARGELSERQGARWLSRLTTSPQLAAILRNYASDDWDDDRFRTLFRAYKAAEGDAAPSPNDKIAKALVQRWDEFERSKEAGEEMAQEKSIVGLIVRGELSELQGARWLSRLTTSPQLAAILRNYASDDWDDDRFRALFRAYKAGEGTAPSPDDKIAMLMIQRWRKSEDDLAHEKAIVGLIARGELSEREGARWLSRLATSPQFAALLRNYASDKWDDDRFRAFFRLYFSGGRQNLPSSGGEDSAADAGGEADKSKHDRTVKMLTDRWRGTGDELSHEKSIVSLIARGQLSELDGARWLSRLMSSPHLAAVLRDYASDDWDEAHFRQVFRIYRNPSALDDPIPEINQLGSSAAAKLAAQGRLSKKRKSPFADTKYIVLNSFPKSGNTWIRQFLSCLCFDGDLDSVPDHYRQEISQAPIFKMPNGDNVRFYKSHDKTLPIIVDGRLIEHAGAIHIRRHPLDVFTSYLHFMHLARTGLDGPGPRGAPFIIEAQDLSEIVGQDLTWAFFGVFMVFGTVNPKFQAAGSWFQNVEEWMGLKSDLPLVSLKYESLIENGAEDLMGIGVMLGKSPDDVRSAFRRAQDLTAIDGRFFWRQQAGTHKMYLSPAQIAAFYKVHGDKLRKFGY